MLLLIRQGRPHVAFGQTREGLALLRENPHWQGARTSPSASTLFLGRIHSIKVTENKK